MATEEKVIKTPYDEALQTLENTDDLTLGELEGRRYLYAKREGYLARAKECLAGKCEGFEAGIEEARENPELYGLATPTKGDR